MFEWLKETDDPDCFFCLLLCLVCFVHSSLLLPDHKASQGHGAQRERHWEGVGGPACLSTARRVREGGGPVNLPELVCESLRDSDSRAAMRGHRRLGLLRLFPGFPTTTADNPCFCPSTSAAASFPCFRQQSPVISNYGRCMAALLSVKPWVRSAGLLMQSKHHRHLAEMKGGAAPFSSCTITSCWNVPAVKDLSRLEGFSARVIR